MVMTPERIRNIGNLKRKTMPFAIQDLQNAYKAYQQFLARNPRIHHCFRIRRARGPQR